MPTILNSVATLIDQHTTTTAPLAFSAGRVIPAPEAGDGESIDASGCVVTPGLVNGHNHLLQTGFRTLPGTRGVPMSEWLGVMARAYHRVGISPELVEATSAVGIAESLLCGVTLTADHMLNWPKEQSIPLATDIAGTIVDTATALGSRIVFVRGTAGDDATFAAESATAMLDALPVGDRGVSADGLAQFAVGPAGAHSDSEATFRELGALARERGLARRTQANEQVDVAIALEKYGKRPIDLLEEWGWLEPGVTIAHLCDITDDELARLAASGVTATHAPGCDVPMGWGIAPVARLLESGIRVGLGTSGAGSNDASHLLADARLAMQVSGLVGPTLPARTLLGMATEGTAVGLGRPELGHLREGAAADFCLWEVDDVADAGVADPVDGLLWARPGRRPRDVYVAGRPVVRDYRLVHADEAGLVDALNAAIRPAQ